MWLKKFATDKFLLTPLREGRPYPAMWPCRAFSDFYSRPCGRGDNKPLRATLYEPISTHAPAGGATLPSSNSTVERSVFLLTPLREGRRVTHFFFRISPFISTHAPAGGATVPRRRRLSHHADFYSRPCGRGDTDGAEFMNYQAHFYSRPCGRGDRAEEPRRSPEEISTHAPAGGATSSGVVCSMTHIRFLLTPLREGRPWQTNFEEMAKKFLLTPLREGRRCSCCPADGRALHFYSRPCGRGDGWRGVYELSGAYFYSRPCGRGDQSRLPSPCWRRISTHAPAGGATGYCCILSSNSSISTHAPAGGATWTSSPIVA